MKEIVFHDDPVDDNYIHYDDFNENMYLGFMCNSGYKYIVKQIDSGDDEDFRCISMYDDRPWGSGYKTKMDFLEDDYTYLRYFVTDTAKEMIEWLNKDIVTTTNGRISS